MLLGVAQFGSVLEWGSRGRGFKSSHPDHYRDLLSRFFVVKGVYIKRWLVIYNLADTNTSKDKKQSKAT